MADDPKPSAVDNVLSNFRSAADSPSPASPTANTPAPGTSPTNVKPTSDTNQAGTSNIAATTTASTQLRKQDVTTSKDPNIIRQASTLGGTTAEDVQLKMMAARPTTDTSVQRGILPQAANTLSQQKQDRIRSLLRRGMDSQMVEQVIAEINQIVASPK